MFRCPIPLAAIFEPIWNLSCGQSGHFRQFPFFARRRIRIALVPFPQHVPRFFFETITRLFAVPNCFRKRKFPPDPVFSDGAQRPAANFFRFHIMGFHPQILQLRMIFQTETSNFQNPIKFFEISAMKKNDGFCDQNGFGKLDRIVGRKWPQKSGQTVDISGLLKDVANAGDLQKFFIKFQIKNFSFNFKSKKFFH